MIFKNDDLKRFYTKLNKLSTTKLFKEWNGEKCFLVRHDIDFDIQLAHNMAVIEQELGIKSTFFFLTSCDYYNILSERSRNLLREILNMGHEIGLHFDPTIYEGNLDEKFKQEAEILSFVTGEEVKSTSLHNPTSHGQYPLFKGYINAYDPKLFSDQYYISDSCFSFRGKNPFQFIEKVNESMIQVLLHPWHFSESGGGYDEIFINSYTRRMQEVSSDICKVNKAFREQVGSNLVEIFKNH